MNQVDWKGLIDSPDPSGALEPGGTEVGQRAIAKLLGADVWRSAVHEYLRLQQGSMVARRVLRLVRPREAMDECGRIATDKKCAEHERVLAASLLATFADDHALTWFEELLASESSELQACAARIVYELVWRDEIPITLAEDLLERLAKHPSARVRESVALSREVLAARAVEGPK